MAKSRASLIDEFGENRRKMLLWQPPPAPVNPFAARNAELEAEIRSWHVALPTDQGAVLEGNWYRVTLSERGEQSVVSPRTKQQAFEVIRTAGKDPFEYFDVSISTMKAECGAAFVKENVPKQQTGPRKLDVIATASPLSKSNQKRLAVLGKAEKVA